MHVTSRVMVVSVGYRLSSLEQQNQTLTHENERLRLELEAEELVVDAVVVGQLLPGPVPLAHLGHGVLGAVDGIGAGAGQGINLDAVIGYRFTITYNRALFPDCVVRQLRVYAAT